MSGRGLREVDLVEARHRKPAPLVFVMDPDIGIRRLLQRELTEAGYCVREAPPGSAGLRTLARSRFDLLILEVSSSWKDDIPFLEAVRAMSQAPILALAATPEEEPMARAFETGVDDYIRKPFSTRELLARIKNVMRRRVQERGKPARVVSGDLEIDLVLRRVRVGGQDVGLAAKPYEVLRVLAEHPGKLRRNQEIIEAVWGAGRIRGSGYLREAIQYLRHRLEKDPAHPRHILTEPRVGYRLEVETAPATHRVSSGA
jgi:two-component system, OmpR family, KDP operon response regulator KdpE